MVVFIYQCNRKELHHSVRQFKRFRKWYKGMIREQEKNVCVKPKLRYCEMKKTKQNHNSRNTITMLLNFFGSSNDNFPKF